MIKKFLLAIMIAFPMSLFAQKFGVINTNELMTSLPEMKSVQEQMEAATKKYEDEFQKLQEEVNKLYADFQNIQNDTETPQSIKERRMQEIQDKAAKVDQFRNTASQDLQRLQETLMTPIQNKMTDAIKTVGTEGSFTFILPKDPGLLLYTGTDVVDVTDQIKSKLGL